MDWETHKPWAHQTFWEKVGTVWFDTDLVPVGLMVIALIFFSGMFVLHLLGLFGIIGGE